MKLLVSACLLGHNCKYNGKNNYSETVAALAREHTLIPVCPEMAGGLGCPRVPCELINGKVISKNGTDCTDAYTRGAEICLKKALEEKVDGVILQPRSPSCGDSEIYDGSFSGKLIPGDGIFARMLKDHKIPIMKASTF